MTDTMGWLDQSPREAAAVSPARRDDDPYTPPLAWMKDARGMESPAAAVLRLKNTLRLGDRR